MTISIREKVVITLMQGTLNRVNEFLKENPAEQFADVDPEKVADYFLQWIDKESEGEGGMTFDLSHRDSSWQMLQPGVWIDPVGAAHIFPDEIVAYLSGLHPEAGWEYTRADYDMIVQAVKEIFGKDVRFIQHTREPQA